MRVAARRMLADVVREVHAAVGRVRGEDTASVTGSAPRRFDSGDDARIRAKSPFKIFQRAF